MNSVSKHFLKMYIIWFFSPFLVGVLGEPQYFGLCNCGPIRALLDGLGLDKLIHLFPQGNCLTFKSLLCSEPGKNLSKHLLREESLEHTLGPRRPLSSLRHRWDRERQSFRLSFCQPHWQLQLTSEHPENRVPGVKWSTPKPTEGPGPF